MPWTVEAYHTRFQNVNIIYGNMILAKPKPV